MNLTTALSNQRHQLTTIILQFLAHLPSDHRKIFILKHYGGCETMEISKRLKCEPTQVERILGEVQQNLLQEVAASLNPDLKVHCAESRNPPHPVANADASFATNSQSDASPYCDVETHQVSEPATAS